MSGPIHRSTDPIAAKAECEGREPAFARPGTLLPNDNVDYGSCGLTKRELFAGMMMQGMRADPEMTDSSQQLAQWAVYDADALLKELAK